MRELAPSIISADLARLGVELAAVEPFAGRWHTDVMDGHFVPNLTIGPMVVKAIASVSALPQDVHLMITNPDETWEWYAKAGAARIVFHADTSADAGALLARMRDAGIGGGLAVNPDVEADEMKRYVGDVDLFVVMSVYPGFSGQKFIPDVLPKLTLLREWVADSTRPVDLVIDGGVNLETAPACLEAGANVLVSASAIFGSADPPATAAALRSLL
jgi:ribulose-phosphate 3-epimerase